MKKIIELAEELVNIEFDTAEDMAREQSILFKLHESIAKRKALEQTPITEEWLKEHGWTRVTKDFYAEPSEKLSIAYNKGNDYEEAGWSIACTRIRLRSLADLYDACELCNIKID